MNDFYEHFLECFNGRFILPVFPSSQSDLPGIGSFFSSRAVPHSPQNFFPHRSAPHNSDRSKRLLLFFLFFRKTKQPFLIGTTTVSEGSRNSSGVACARSSFFCDQRVNGRVGTMKLNLTPILHWLHELLILACCSLTLVFILFYIFFIEILFDRSYITIRIPDHISFIQIQVAIYWPCHLTNAQPMILFLDVIFHFICPSVFSSARSISIYLRRYFCVVPFNI